MTTQLTKPSSGEAMFMLAEAYAIEDYVKETGADLKEVKAEDFAANRRKLEIWTLNSAIDMDDPGSWVSSSLLDAVKFMNGRALEQVPNLHFMAEEKHKELSSVEGVQPGVDVSGVAADLANREIRKACEAWLKDCNVSCSIDDIIAEQQLEH